MAAFRVALVHAHSWPEVRRGGERLVDDLRSYLRGKGHKVDVFWGTRGESQFHDGQDGRTYKLRVPRIRPLEGYGLTPVETFGMRALVPLLLHRYDVVHAFTPTAALAALAAGQPTVYTIIGHPTHQSLPDQRFQRRALSRAITRSTAVAALSRSAAASVDEAFGRLPVVLPPGVTTAQWAPNTEPRVGPPRLLFSGDVSNPDKGVRVLLAAFDRLLDRHPDARLGLSGPGRMERALREVGVAGERISASIDVLGTGEINDLPDRYRSTHVTVLPSRDEAFGIVLVESLASGTPVVGGKPGGAEDIVTTPEVGKLAPFGDADALADAIDECIELARDPSTPGHCHTHAQAWDWTKIGHEYEALYASVAGRRRIPGAALWKTSRVRRDAQEVRSEARPNPS